MNRELIEDDFLESGFTPMQAEALSRILAEMATKEDLAVLKAELTWRIVGAMAVLATLVTILDVVIACGCADGAAA